jgi:hypothetical protein
MEEQLGKRMQSAVSNLNDDEPDFSDEEYDKYLEQEEEEEEVEISEEEMLKMLDQQEDPFVTCARLFKSVELESLGLEILTPDNVQQLKTHGYLILENVIPETTQQQATEQTLNMVSSNKLHAAGSSKSAEDDPFRDNKARTDLTTWLHHDEETGALQEIMTSLFVRLGSDLSKIINLRKHWKQAEYQLAYYKGCETTPGYYEKHRDAFPDDGSNEDGEAQRRLTTICYVNHAWKQGDGGQLRIWERKSDGRQNKDIDPIGGRLVVFLSGAVDHQVMATHKDRVAITAWYS